MDTKLQLVPDPQDGDHNDAVGEGHPGALPFSVPPRMARARQMRRGKGNQEPRCSTRGSARLGQLAQDERGAVTAEYAIVIMAAVAFAGLLVAILRSAEIRAMLVQLVEDALGAAG